MQSANVFTAEQDSRQPPAFGLSQHRPLGAESLQSEEVRLTLYTTMVLFSSNWIRSLII